MEQQQTPKRRGRPPKNPIANITRLKKPAAQSLGPERRQTRHSKTSGGLFPVPAGGNINLLQDPSDYQITLVDVKSSYNKETGMFTISGLRRGMIDIIPWSSASTASDSPKMSRVEIDLTLSDSDDARVLAKFPPSAKRKIMDEDIPEIAISEKRQKMSGEPSIEVETTTAMSTEVPLSPIALMGSVEVGWASRGSPLEEGKFPEDLAPGNLIGQQEPSPNIHNMHDHIRSNGKPHLDEVTTMTNDLEVSRGNASNQRLGGLHSALGSVSNLAKDSIHALKISPSEQTENSLRTLEGIPNIQVDFQNPPFQQLKQRQPTVDSSKFGQVMVAEPEGSTIAEVRSESDGLGDRVKTEPGSTSDSPIILDDSNEPARAMATHTEQAITQVANPNDTKVALEQQKFDKPPISGGQQMGYGDRPILGEQVVLPVELGPPNSQVKPEKKITALAEHEILEGRSVSEKQTRFEEEDVVFIEQRSIEGQANTSKDGVLQEGHISKEGAEAFIDQRIAVGPVMTEVRPMAVVEPAIIREQPTIAEQDVTSPMEGILGELATAHTSQAAFEERPVVGSVPEAPYKGEGIPTVLSGRTLSDERAVPNRGHVLLGMETNLGERDALSEEPIVIDAHVPSYERRVPDVEVVGLDGQAYQATQEDAAVLGEQDIFNDRTLAFERITHGEMAVALEGQAIFDEKATALGDQVIPDEEVVILYDQDTPDEEIVIVDGQATPGQEPNPDEQTSPETQVIPVKQVTSSEPPDLNEQILRTASSRNDTETASTDLVGGSVDDGNVNTHTPWGREFSGDSAASQREKLEPPNVSKECPVCKEKFRDMSIPDLRQHILSCLEEERPQPPEYADEEYLGLVRRTTVFLDDLGSDNDAGEGLDNNDLHMDDLPILEGPISATAGFRDTPTSDSERTLSEPISDDERLPGPYEEKDSSSDEMESPAVDIIETIASSRFRTITDPENFLQSLQDPEEKSTASLYRSIENATDVLKAWQDEWMAIEARVAKLQQRKAHNPRAVLDPVVFEDQKEADLYGYRWDPNPKKRGQQDPVAQRTGRLVGGRELRRRAPALKALAVDSDAGTQEGRRRTRSRRGDGASDPNGSGIEAGRPAGIPSGLEVSSIRRSMKRSADLMDADTPEQSDVPKRRGRPRLNPLPARIQDIRNGNAFSATSTESEGTPAPVIKRRGRPPKNFKANQTPGTKVENTEASKGKQRADKIMGNSTPGAPPRVGPSEVVKKPKSAKRSAAMQAWWDQRKAEKKARMEAAAANATPDADASAAGPSTQKPSVGKSTREVGSTAKTPKNTVAGKDDTQLLQKRRGRPPKQPVILAAKAPEVDSKVYQPKRRGRPPKSGPKGNLTKSLPNVDGAADHGDLDSAPNTLFGKPTGLEQYEQLASGSVPEKLTKKRRNLSGGDDASSSTKRAKNTPSSFDADSDAIQSSESSSNDTDDDGDDSYYG
ncbi:MAG: hypothetical protein M1840_008181 [Geoglossum simile]|nr:MAG: hypothetical protein M1840_008181 [Geoglossum simile]